MSLAGALADARKSATRLYMTNFVDKGRQATVDTLLGRLVNQKPVQLYDPVNDYVDAEMSRRSGEYTSASNIRIWVGTFNLNGKLGGVREDLSSWLWLEGGSGGGSPEIVAIGLQEIVELSPQQIMNTDPARRNEWERAISATLNRHARAGDPSEYVLLRSGQLVGAALLVYAKTSVLKYIKNVEGQIKKTGLSGMAGNKGAVACRHVYLPLSFCRWTDDVWRSFDFASTRLCFITAHLAAGFANYDERNRDYQTVAHGLRFLRNRTIDDHDAVIWLGDFNYRVGLPNERVRKHIEAGDLATLYQHDQVGDRKQL